jgi:hypothetical protein
MAQDACSELGCTAAALAKYNFFAHLFPSLKNRYSFSRITQGRGKRKTGNIYEISKQSG